MDFHAEGLRADVSREILGKKAVLPIHCPTNDKLGFCANRGAKYG